MDVILKHRCVLFDDVQQVMLKAMVVEYSKKHSDVVRVCGSFHSGILGEDYT